MDVSDVLAQAAVVPVGGYISVWKIIVVLIVLLIWARLLTWTDKDAVAAHLPRVPINIGLVGGWILGFFLFFVIPGFLFALGVLLLTMIVEAATYLTLRHQKVGLNDLQTQFSDWIHSFTDKGSKVVAAPDEVILVGSNGNPIPQPPTDAPDRAAYDAIQAILTDPLKKNAEEIAVAPIEGATVMQFVVDGMNYNGGSLDRQSAAAAITFLKQVARLDVGDKRKPQTGNFRVLVNGKRHDVQLTTAGSASGEQMSMIVDPKKRHELKLTDLGLSNSQLKLLQDYILDSTGIVLIAAPPGQGLTTLMYSIIGAHDAFTTHIHTIERDPEQDLEGITQNTLPLNASPAEEAKLVIWVVSQEPDALMVTQVTDPRSAAELIKFASSGRRVYVGLRTGNTFDALAQWRKLVGDDKLAMKHLSLIIAGRVLRKLCMACKVGYAPDPATLKKLNMDPEQVTKLYQARTQPMRDQKGNPIPCEFCQELRFKGRTGVYEIFPIDDDVRQAVIGGGTVNQLKGLFRKQRGRYLQEQALSLVEEGETSVQEVLRVLRSDDTAAAARAGSNTAGAGGGGAAGAAAAAATPARSNQQLTTNN